MKKYRILKNAEADEVMYHESLLGFRFPITRQTAEKFNALADDTEMWHKDKGIYSNRQKKTNYAEKIFCEIVAIIQKSGAVASDC